MLAVIFFHACIHLNPMYLISGQALKTVQTVAMKIELTLCNSEDALLLALRLSERADIWRLTCIAMPVIYF